MGVNSRLVGIVIFFAALGGALWWMLGDRKAEAPTIGSQTIAKRAAAPEPVVESTAAATETAEPARTRPTTPRKVSAPEPKKPDKPRTGDGEIVVSVVTEQGQSVTGATIILELVDWEPEEEPGDDLLRFEAVSGADGAYTFADLPDGDYAVRAWTATAGQSGDAYLTDTQKSVNVTLELWAGAPTSGIVVNTSGEPIAGAVVHVYETDRFPGLILATTRSTSARVYTNERGEFRFPILWRGDWRLFAKADGYASAITETIKGGDTNVRIVLGKGASVAGKVIDELTKGGLPNIEVKLASDFPRDNFSAKSDIDGAFVITAVREGTYKITVVDEDLVPTGDAPELQLRDGQDEKGVEILVTPGAIITGRVYDKTTGEGYAKAKVGAHNQSGTGESRSEIATDSEGRYEIRGLAKGAYEIQLGQIPGYTSRDRYDQAKQIAVEPGKAYGGIDFVLNRGLTLTGSVVDDKGGPVAKARVSAQPVEGGTYSNGEADELGSFVLTGFLPAQEIMITAQKDGLSARKVENIKLASESVADIIIVMIGEATIEGIVVDTSGKPVASAGVYAQHSTDRNRGSSVSSTANGAFKLTGLSKGNYSIQVARNEGGPWFNDNRGEEVSIEDGQHLTGLRLVLESIGSFEIRGRGTNRKGEGIAGISLNSWSVGARIQGQTGGDGNYVLRNVPAGQLNVQAQHNKYSSTNFTANAGDTNADFVMEGRGKIEGRVVDANTGRPIEQFQVLVYKGGSQDYNSYMQREFRFTTDPEGAFVWENAEAGQNTLLAKSTGYATAHVGINAVADDTVSGVVARLFPGVVVEGTVTNSSGATVVGARIFDGPVPEQWRRDQQNIAVSDGSGDFTLESMSPETTVISAYHPEYAPGSANVSLSPGATNHVDIVLPVGAAVTGTIRVGGQPFAGAYVNVMPDGNNRAQQGSQAGSDGVYSVKGLTPGTTTVSAYLPNQERSGTNRGKSKSVVLQDGMTSTIDFDFSAVGGTIEGYLTYGGEPVTQGWLSGSSGDDTSGRESVHGQVQDRGYYRLEGLSPGDAIVMYSVQINDEQMSRRSVVNVTDGQVARHDVEFNTGGRVRGTVRGIPQGWNASVMIVTGEVSLDLLSGRDQEVSRRFMECCMISAASTQADGSFSTAGIDPGDYTVFVRAFDPNRSVDPQSPAANMRSATGTITISEGQEATIDLRLE